MLALFYYNVAHHNNELYFQKIVEQTEKSIQKRYFLYEQALWGGLGLLNASNNVGRQEWEYYVSTLRIDETLPGINGIGFIDYVREENLTSYLETTRLDGWPNFSNKPETEFQDKFIIKYIIPENVNFKAVGLDIGFEANRRAAAQLSRDIGKPALTKKIELVQDNKKRAGFLLLLPFYQGNSLQYSLDQRRQNILGWVYAPFIADNFFRNLDYINSNLLHYRVYDGEKINQNLIYSNVEEDTVSGYSIDTTLEVAARNWQIKWQANNNFIPPSNIYIAYVIVLAGFIFTLIIFFFLKFILDVNRRVFDQVETQTSELTQSKQFLSLMMNSIPDLVFVKDKDFKIVRANQAFLNIYSPERRDKVIGYTTIENFTKEETDIFLKQDQIAFDNGISQVHEEITLYNGRIMSIFTTKVRFYDENNEEYILCIARDVSDLMETQKGLERKVEERTQEYKKQRVIAEQAGKAKEEFLANMSHELRTPLNSIIGLTKILIDEGDFKKEESEALHIVDRASNSLLRTVNDILDISKIEAGKVVLEEKGFDVVSLLHSLIDQIKPLANQKGLEITDNLRDLKECYVIADEHRITRIVTNLMGNAIQYTHEGCVDILIEIQEKNNEKIDFKLSVNDTGIGISQDQIDGIFDKFAQAEKPSGHNYGGTGLGLSITKQLIDLMEGDITVDSQLGEGSTFTVELLLSKTTQEATYIYNDRISQIVDSKTKNVNRKPIFDARILVAEDHEFNQVFINKILDRMGCKVYKIVGDGALALEEVQREEYDVILMDYHMPNLNGYEATQKIRHYEIDNKTGNHIPIIAMTADVMPGTEEKCLKAGMNAYISKPIDEASLKNILSKWFAFSPQKMEQGDQDEKVNEYTSEVCLDLTLLEEYTDGDAAAQKNLIQIFYSKSLKDIEALKSSSEDGPNKQWCDAAHSLKGSAGYIGASTLKKLCAIGQSMENVTKQERADIHVQIQSEHDKICTVLRDKDLLETT